MTIRVLRQKWKPILEVRKVISKEVIEEYNRDVSNYIRENPNWEENVICI